MPIFKMDKDIQLIWEAWSEQRPPADHIRKLYMFNIDKIKDGQWPHTPKGHYPPDWITEQLKKMFNNLIKYYIHFDDPKVGKSDEEYVYDVSSNHNKALKQLHMQLNVWASSDDMEHLSMDTLEELQDLFDYIWDVYKRQSPEGRPGIDNHI